VRYRYISLLFALTLATNVIAGPATLSLSGSNPLRFGSTALGGSLDLSLVLTNSSTTTAATSLSQNSNATSEFQYKGGTFPGVGGTCTDQLAKKSTCSIVLTFAPASARALSATLSFMYGNGTSTVSFNRGLSGIGIPATLNLGRSAVSAGIVGVGTSKNITLTLSNSSPTAATTLTPGGMTSQFSYTGGSYPGTGGTCGNSLSGNSTCSLSLTFSPVASGLVSGNIGIIYNDGALTQQAFITLSGTGAVAVVQAPTSVTFFGATQLGLTQDASVTLTNTNKTMGATLLAEGSPALSGVIQFKGGSFPGTGGTCGVSLAASSSCKLVYTFAPSAAGANSATAKISYFDGQYTQTLSVNLSGTGAAAANINIGAVNYNFPLTEVGTPSSVNVAITNSGGSPATSVGATFSGPFGFKGGTFPGTGGTCSTQLGPKKNCIIVAAFSPNAGTDYSESLNVSFNDGMQVRNAGATLAGVGKSVGGGLTIPGGETSVFSDTAAGGISFFALSVKNNGTATVGFSASSNFTGVFSFPGGFPGSAGTCSTKVRLARSATCTLYLAFNPQAVSNYSGSLQLLYNVVQNGQLQTVAHTLQGRGFAPAVLSFSSPLVFSNVKTNHPSSTAVTVTNSGAATANSIYFGGIGGAFSQTNNCPSSLPSLGTCTVTYTYAPLSGTSDSANSLLYYDNGAGMQTLSENLSGTSVASALLVAQVNDFGSLLLNSFSDQTIVITNQRNATANSISIGTTDGPFAFKGGSYPGQGGTCSSSLVAGNSCTVVVRFTPISLVLSSNNWTITYNDGTATNTAPLALTGTGAAGLTTAKDFGVSNDGAFSTVSVSATAPYVVTAQFFDTSHALVNTVSVASLGALPTVYLARSRVSGHSAILMYYGYDVKLAIYDRSGNSTSGLKTWASSNNGYSPSFDISDSGTAAVSWSSYNNWGFNTYLVTTNGTVTDMSGGLVNDGACYISGGIALNKSTGAGVATCQGYHSNYLEFRRFNANGSWSGQQTVVPNSSNSANEDSHFVGMNDSGQFVIVQQGIGGDRWYANFFNADSSYVGNLYLGSTGSASSDGVSGVHVRITTIGSDYIIPWKDDSRNGVYFGHYRRVHPNGTIESSDSPAADGMNSIQIDGNNNVYYISQGIVKMNDFSIAP